MHFLDYLIIALVLCISSLIGVYYRMTGNRQQHLNEYLYANHEMPVWAVSLSIMTSFITAISLLGISSEIYSYGFAFFLTNFGYGLFTPVAAFLYLPVFYKLRITNVFDYLGMRFGKISKFLASLVIILQMITYNGAVLYAPSIALESLTNLSKYKLILILGLICTFYSTIGGIKAVLITDLFQAFLMYIGLLCVICYAIFDTGSLGKMLDISNIGGRLNYLDFTIDLTTRHTFWNLIIGGGFIYLSLYAINSSQVQKCLTTRSLKSAQFALIFQWPLIVFLSFCTAFSSIAIYAKYYGCDPVLSGKLNKYDGILPYYVIENLSRHYGLCGFFVSAILSASLSTISSLINNLSLIVYEDYFKIAYKYLYNSELSTNKEVLVVKILVFTFGIISITISFAIDQYSSILQLVLTIFSAVGGPMVGLFTLGMFTTTANDKGSSLAFISGLLLTIYVGHLPKSTPDRLPMLTDGCSLNETMSLNMFQNIINNKTAANLHISTEVYNTSEHFDLSNISYLWLSPLGFIYTFMCGILLSSAINVFKRHQTRDFNPDLYTPPLALYLRKRFFEKSRSKRVKTTEDTHF